MQIALKANKYHEAEDTTYEPAGELHGVYSALENSSGCRFFRGAKFRSIFGRVLHLELEIDQLRFAEMNNGDYSHEKESRGIEHEKGLTRKLV